jgi:hypothetical protein
MKLALIALLAVLGTVVAGPGVTSAAAAEITVTPIGTPTWQPVDFHVFAAPIGTAATGYAEFLGTLAALLPGPNHVSDPAVGILPGAPHPPPYDDELATGVIAQGYPERTMFSAAEFSNGLGVYLAYMIIPGPGSAIGSSQDDPSGPIVSNALQPIHSVYSTFRNGVLFKDVEMYDTIVNAGFEGYSHIPHFFANNFDFASDPSTGILGSYEYRIEVTDASGSGWTISAPFQVVPEPASITLLGFGIAGLLAWHRAGRNRATR